METYTEMKARHQKEVNALPLGFAFSFDQWHDLLNKWGITEEEAKAGAVLCLGKQALIKATDKDFVIGTFKRIHDEEQAAIKADTTGEGFIYQMFVYELNNHEFSYTADVDETLEELKLTREDIKKDPALKHGLLKAMEDIIGAADPDEL